MSLSTHPVAEFAEANQLSRGEKIRLMYRNLVHSVRETPVEPSVKRMLDLGCALLKARGALLFKPVADGKGNLIQTDSLSEKSGASLQLEGLPPSSLQHHLDRASRVMALDATGDNLVITYNGDTCRPVAATLITPNASDTLVLCFLGDSPKERSANDLEILELLAEGVACMIDIQKTQAQRKLTDQAMFASGSIKTLEEYQTLATLPEAYGVPARVLEVLQRRVGRSGLSIGDVADDLNLSKRTLQRRLQQQDINFADLRDQVRFHYSINYLVYQHLSIDSISNALDFSDRTSFTNAFKRWTGLSPSTFRKLFRDYV